MKTLLVSLMHGDEQPRQDLVNIMAEDADEKVVVWTGLDPGAAHKRLMHMPPEVRMICDRRSLTYGQGIMLAAEESDADILVYASARRAVVHQHGWLPMLTAPFNQRWCGMTGCVRPCRYDRIARLPTDIFEPQIHVQGGCFAVRRPLLEEVGFGKFPQVFSDVYLSHGIIKRGHFLTNVPAVSCDEGEAAGFRRAMISVGYPDRTNRRMAFEAAVKTPGDINEHLHTLRAYAGRAARIIEFGTRGGVSTLAFLCGQPDRLRTIDIDPQLVDPGAIAFLQENRGCTEFIQEIGDSRARTPEACDLLFIDTDHNYDCLTAELNRHHGTTSRWIIMHDTEAYPDCMAAVKDFLAREPQWILLHHFPNNNGLTILERNATYV